MNKILEDVLARARKWPESAQSELAALASEIEAEISGNAYAPTKAEIEGIERGLADAEAGRLATQTEIDTVFAKYRQA